MSGTRRTAIIWRHLCRVCAGHEKNSCQLDGPPWAILEEVVIPGESWTSTNHEWKFSQMSMHSLKQKETSLTAYKFKKKRVYLWKKTEKIIHILQILNNLRQNWLIFDEIVYIYIKLHSWRTDAWTAEARSGQDRGSRQDRGKIEARGKIEPRSRQDREQSRKCKLIIFIYIYI